MINLLIADDHSIVREGLKKILNQMPGFRVAAEAADGDEVMQHLHSMECFDLLLLDMGMPGIRGIELIGRIKACRPDLPVLIFSMQHESQSILHAIRAGAAGYVTKNSGQDILTYAIRKVAGGGKYIDPSLSEQMAFDAALPEQHDPHTRLSDRELEVFGMLVAGKRITEIAEQLAISNKTVSTHKLHLMEKMKIGSTAELVHYAIKHGLFQPEA